MSVVNLTEEQVKCLLTWPLVYEAVEQALRSITEIRTSETQPTANQPERIFTPAGNGKGTKWSSNSNVWKFILSHLFRCAAYDARFHWQLSLEAYGSR